MSDFVDIDKIIKDYTKDLPEDKVPSGAMVCDYNTFKSIYQLNARASIRNEKQIIVGMIKIKDFEGGNTATPEMRKNLFNSVGTTLASSLRRDDVVTGFDTSQYLIMLSNLTMENADNVLKRLMKRITTDTGTNIDFETQLEPLKTPDHDDPFGKDVNKANE
jgi:GGDEF domain-containing protein